MMNFVSSILLIILKVTSFAAVVFMLTFEQAWIVFFNEPPFLDNMFHRGEHQGSAAAS